jgi:RNA polymerase sigma-70 factor (ECF subfamily)
MDVRGLAGKSGAPAHTLMHSDEELVGRACGGEEEAFRVIFERYSRPVTGFIFGMVGGGGLAEELAQETFVRAYRKLASLRDPSRLPTWLFGIARNVAREAIQSRRDAVRRMDADGSAVNRLSDKAPPPDEQLLSKELYSAIESAFMTLGPDKRLVFALRVFQQRSYEEIAQMTGFSLSKVKTDVSRARAEMRRLVRPRGEVDDAL